ncbi:PilZ domain-containing protein [Vibrio hannami]|uniref:PilZ domain-containing protein n=1 Tax=Vibrio hannami TaxID=2717094 RepID=UPI00240EB70D|nr:PilZ domain-containing protein [Vibrio hannami]MDG3087090.1 PilZ domain-containing protein [Vibrio hannami]
MPQENHEQRRQFYRLRYPRNDRPVITLMDKKYHVCEISEQGLRIVFLSHTPVAIGLTVSGNITFHDNEKILIEGDILRQDDLEVIIKLSKGVSFKRMTVEQLYLRKKYPKVYARKKKATKS